MSAHPLSHFLNPASIAIVGASADPRRISGKPIRFLREQGYRGTVYPVNPKYDQMNGWACYPSLAALPAAPELVVVALPSDAVLGCLEQAVDVGAKAALVFTAGFAETGGEGAALQARMAALVQGSGLRIIGPNCIGLVNLHNGVTPTFSSSLEGRPQRPGEVAFITQSGAFGSFYVADAQEAGLGISSWINTGNEVDVDIGECLEYYAGDPQTRVVTIWAEGVRYPDRLGRGADAARAAGKPVFMLKAGRSEAGVRAASAHTASVPMSDPDFDALCARHGIVRVADLHELLDAAFAALSKRLPKGRGVAVFGVSGGAGVFIADQCDRYGLEVPALEAGRVEQVRALLPWYASARNPVDATAQLMNDPANVQTCLRLVAEDPSIHSLIVFMGLQENIAEQVSRAIAEVDRQIEKPLFVTWMLAPPVARATLGAAGIPLFPDPSRCVAGLAALTRFAVG